MNAAGDTPSFVQLPRTSGVLCRHSVGARDSSSFDAPSLLAFRFVSAKADGRAVQLFFGLLVFRPAPALPSCLPPSLPSRNLARRKKKKKIVATCISGTESNRCDKTALLLHRNKNKPCDLTVDGYNPRFGATPSATYTHCVSVSVSVGETQRSSDPATQRPGPSDQIPSAPF